eukprot:UN05710
MDYIKTKNKFIFKISKISKISKQFIPIFLNFDLIDCDFDFLVDSVHDNYYSYSVQLDIAANNFAVAVVVLDNTVVDTHF